MKDQSIVCQLSLPIKSRHSFILESDIVRRLKLVVFASMLLRPQSTRRHTAAGVRNKSQIQIREFPHIKKSNFNLHEKISKRTGNEVMEIPRDIL